MPQNDRPSTLGNRSKSLLRRACKVSSRKSCGKDTLKDTQTHTQALRIEAVIPNRESYGRPADPLDRHLRLPEKISQGKLGYVRHFSRATPGQEKPSIRDFG